METLAYLHLAVAYEEPTNPQPLKAFGCLKNFEGLRWKKLSSRPLMRVLSLALASATLSLTSNALAAVGRGDSGSQVTAIQENLTALGYFDGPITGYFGSLTESSVMQFQQANALPADGIVGSETQAALQQQTTTASSQSFGKTSSSKTLQRGASGSDVEALQSSLQAAGYYDGPITGTFGSLTEAGVIRWQQAKGVKANGIVDSSTLAALTNKQGRTTPALAAPSSTSEDFLLRGDTGPAVSDLQRLLSEAGYFDGKIDGYFDTKTEAAAIRFQRDARLRADGVVGSETLAALSGGRGQEERRPTGSSLNIPKYSVLDLQKRLKERGFYDGDLDGQLGLETQAAIDAAQRHYGVSSNDILVGRF